MSDSQYSAEERRRYFRIDDCVRLTYRQVSPDEMEAGIRQLDEGKLDQFTLMSSLTALNGQMAIHMRRIQNRDPDVALYLKSLDQKIELLAQALVAQDVSLLTQSGVPVNLSAGGLGLDVSEPIEAGTMLELKMLLLPSFTGLVTYAEVVRCEQLSPSEQATGHSHRLNLEFRHLREQDQDLLIRHILRRQGEQLRAERLGEED